MSQIFIVDDDRAVRFVLATALRDAGHEVAEFADAEVAQTALRRAAPQLLVCDVRLPGANGLVLLRDIKAAHPALPVIVIAPSPTSRPPPPRTVKARSIICPSLSILRRPWRRCNVPCTNRNKRMSRPVHRRRGTHCWAKARRCAQCSA